MAHRINFEDLNIGDDVQVEYRLFLAAEEKYTSKIKDISYKITDLYPMVITLENGMSFECMPNDDIRIEEIDGAIETMVFKAFKD